MEDDGGIVRVVSSVPVNVVRAWLVGCEDGYVVLNSPWRSSVCGTDGWMNGASNGSPEFIAWKVTLSSGTLWVWDSLVRTWPYTTTASFFLQSVCYVSYLTARYVIGPYSDILREEILSECSTLISVSAVWHAIIHAICAGGIMPNCKVAWQF